MALVGEMELTFGVVDAATSGIDGRANRMMAHIRIGLDFDIAPPMQSDKG